jgi:tetratricopeptide (TPR) repeat protein
MKIQRIFFLAFLAILMSACNGSGDELNSLVEARQFTKAAKWIQENPDKKVNVNDMVHVARHYRERVNFEVAQSILEQVIKKDSGNVPGRLLLANVYREKSMYNEALVIYNQIVNIDSVRFIALPERARLYIHIGELEKAEKDIAEAKSIQPKYYATFLAEGLLHYTKGNTEESLDFFEIAESLDPGLSAEASLYAGFILLKNKLNYDAMGKFTRAIEVGRDINKGYAFVNRGVCQINIQDTAFACDDWDSALVYIPVEAQTYVDNYCKNFR